MHIKKQYYTIFCIVYLSCTQHQKITKGTYHYYDSQETDGLVSKTIRIEPNGEFCMFGIMIDPSNKEESNGSIYSRYITFGNWKISGNFLILNTNLNYLENYSRKFSIGDTVFTNIRSWNLAEMVIIVQNDSFLISETPKSLIDVKSKKVFVYAPK